MSDEKYPAAVLPDRPTPANMIKFLRGKASTWYFQSVRQIVLAALANQYDRLGEAINAAQTRAAAGRLAVQYHWYHPPTGLRSNRAFHSRHTAWLFLNRMSDDKGLRSKLAAGKVGSGVLVRSGRKHAGSFVPVGRSYVLARDVPPQYWDATTSNPVLPLAEIVLVVTVSSGYTARVKDPTTLGPPGWLREAVFPTLSKEV